MCGSALLLGDVAQFVQLLLTRQYAPHGRQKAARKDIPIAGRTQNTRHPLQCLSYPLILLGWQHSPRRRDNRTKASDSNTHLVDAVRYVGERCRLTEKDRRQALSTDPPQTLFDRHAGFEVGRQVMRLRCVHPPIEEVIATFCFVAYLDAQRGDLKKVQSRSVERCRITALEQQFDLADRLAALAIRGSNLAFVERPLDLGRRIRFKREKGAPNQNGEPRAKLRLGKPDRQMSAAVRSARIRPLVLDDILPLAVDGRCRPLDVFRANSLDVPVIFFTYQEEETFSPQPVCRCIVIGLEGLAVRRVPIAGQLKQRLLQLWHVVRR